MSFKRQSFAELVTGEELTRDMISIGMLFGGAPGKPANIENTIFSSVFHSLRNQDFRVLAMVTLWLEKHSFILNASRIVKLINRYKDYVPIFRYWVAFSQWHSSDHRFQILRKQISTYDRVGLYSGAKFLAEKNGQDFRFEKTCLIVPDKLLSKKDWLVLDPKNLANFNDDYKWRLIIGPTFRADMWSALVNDSTLPAAKLARLTYGSYATAHRVKKEFEIYKETLTRGEKAKSS
jgi:hypothetical protein